MLNFIINLAVFSLIICESHEESSYEIKLESHLAHLQKMRQPYPTLDENRMKARDYIQERFKAYNLTTMSQEFKAKIAIKNSITEVNGWNVMAESGNPNKSAPVLIIGTYYDNTGQWNPWMESGASVAAMLETARIFQTLRQRHGAEKTTKDSISVFFVAFDLNIKEYDPFVPNNPCGSENFMKNWLSTSWPSRKVLGAIILDSIAAFNEEENTQTVSQNIKKSFPATFSKIQRSGFRGNFLSMTYNFSDIIFAHGFYKEFKQAALDTPIKLVSMPVPSNYDIERRPLSDIIWNTPLFDFWKNESFPTILLSDWVEGRTDEFARQKSDLVIDDFMKSKQKIFVETTTKTLINLLFRLCRGSKPSGDKPVLPTPNFPDVSSSSTLKLEFTLYIIPMVTIVLSCRSLL